MLKKRTVKSRGVVKVSFELLQAELPQDVAIESVHLLGDFNGWDQAAAPMKYQRKAKAYRATVELEPDHSYQFRYLVNGNVWCNEWSADGYTSNEHGEDNCVVVTPALIDGSR